MLLTDAQPPAPAASHLSVLVLGPPAVGKSTLCSVLVAGSNANVANSAISGSAVSQMGAGHQPQAGVSPPSVPPALAGLALGPYVPTIEDSVTFQFVRLPQPTASGESAQSSAPDLQKNAADPSAAGSAAASMSRRPQRTIITLMDAGGHPRLRPIWPSIIASADAFMLVYDVGDRKSLLELWNFFRLIVEIKKTRSDCIPMLLVGSMVDTVTSEMSSESAAATKAKNSNAPTSQPSNPSGTARTKRPREVPTTAGQAFAEILRIPFAETSGRAPQSIAYCLRTLFGEAQTKARSWMSNTIIANASLLSNMDATNLLEHASMFRSDAAAIRNGTANSNRHIKSAASMGHAESKAAGSSDARQDGMWLQDPPPARNRSTSGGASIKGALGLASSGNGRLMNKSSHRRSASSTHSGSDAGDLGSDSVPVPISTTDPISVGVSSSATNSAAPSPVPTPSASNDTSPLHYSGQPTPQGRFSFASKLTFRGSVERVKDAVDRMSDLRKIGHSRKVSAPTHSYSSSSASATPTAMLSPTDTAPPWSMLASPTHGLASPAPLSSSTNITAGSNSSHVPAPHIDLNMSMSTTGTMHDRESAGSVSGSAMVGNNGTGAPVSIARSSTGDLDTALSASASLVVMSASASASAAGTSFSITEDSHDAISDRMHYQHAHNTSQSRTQSRSGSGSGSALVGCIDIRGEMDTRMGIVLPPPVPGSIRHRRDMVCRLLQQRQGADAQQNAQSMAVKTEPFSGVGAVGMAMTASGTAVALPPRGVSLAPLTSGIAQVDGGMAAASAQAHPPGYVSHKSHLSLARRQIQELLDELEMFEFGDSDAGNEEDDRDDAGLQDFLESVDAANPDLVLHKQ